MHQRPSQLSISSVSQNAISSLLVTLSYLHQAAEIDGISSQNVLIKCDSLVADTIHFMKWCTQILEDNQCALSANGTTNISVPDLIIRQANKSPALTTTPMANLWGALYMEGIICPREDGRGHVPKHMPPCPIVCGCRRDRPVFTMVVLILSLDR